MSQLYLYAVVEAPVAGVAGMEGEAIEALPAAGVWLAAGRVEAVPAPSLETLRAHDAAVRRLADTGAALLPARYGQTAADAAALASRFAPATERLRARLGLVRGCVQMTLRIGGLEAPAVAAPPGRPGTGYLRGKRQRAQGEGFSPAVDALHAACVPLRRAERVAWNDAQRRLTFYHLVPTIMLPAYRDAVAAHRPALGSALTLSGPWPPYAFTDG